MSIHANILKMELNLWSLRSLVLTHTHSMELSTQETAPCLVVQDRALSEPMSLDPRANVSRSPVDLLPMAQWD